MSNMEQVPEPVATVRDLRNQALTADAASLGIEPKPGAEHVFGVVMEMGYPDALVSLVVFADGTASLYFGTGGGVVGAGKHIPVRAAALEMLASAGRVWDLLAPADEFPLPGVQRVRFYVRGFDGTRTGEGDGVELGEGKLPLSPLFHAGHRLIEQIRIQSDRSSG